MMVYYEKWRSYFYGGVGMVVLGIFMLTLAVLFVVPYSTGMNTSLARFIFYGILFIAIGALLLFVGYLFRQKTKSE